MAVCWDLVMTPTRKVHGVASRRLTRHNYHTGLCNHFPRDFQVVKRERALAIGNCLN